MKEEHKICVCLVCEMEGKPRFMVPATADGTRAMKSHVIESHSLNGV